jgi:hypothetical protein
MHWPGEEYPVGEQGDQTIVATFEIVDARLAEVSAVYDGATPGAMLTRAQAMAEAGELTPETARRLEVKYRIKLPGAARSWPGADLKPAAIPSPSGDSGASPERSTTVDELQQINSLLDEVNAAGETALDKVRWLVEETVRLAPLADQGRQYRSDLIADALAEGVRAMGDAFPTETYKGIMERAGIEEIKELKANFTRQAALRFPGGRQTTDTEEQTPPPDRRKTPAAAHRA